MTPEPSQFEDLPERLIADLRAAHSRDASVPAAIDARILNEARVGFARRTRFRRFAIYGGFAAAAAVLIFSILLPAMHPTDKGHGSRQAVSTQMLNVMPPAGEDVDHDGKVNILDAFFVARLVEAGEKIDEAYDVNGDGKVDQADVDRIAHAAVAASPDTAGHGRMQ
jgi:hypothetical protein